MFFLCSFVGRGLAPAASFLLCIFIKREKVPPCGAGFFSTWKRNQKTLGGGRNRQDRQSRSCLHAALPLEPPLRGTRTCEVEQNFRRAKSERLSAVPSGPLGPGFAKIVAAAAPQPRLALPSRWRLVLGRRARPPGRAALNHRRETP